MCNEVARRIALGELRNDFSQVRITLTFPEGAPNMPPLDSVRITDTTVIVRAAPDPVGADAAADLVSRRWSWPGAGGRPVYNYRSDGRDLGNHGAKGGRCLIPVDSFFEFTASTDPKQKRKDKWRFSPADADWLCIAGLWRADPQIGEAFTMLTCPPGPDVAPYHARQVVVMPRPDWAAWLDGSGASQQLCRPAPAGTLVVEKVER
ncbi:SOS response-associated peptidase family protein [Sphingomonas japonica]|uniref:Abasic site processing protein n=1 Tax=Sphingomonas japonica TaxID=511662 RepID=A0ABX0U1B8_9SPHN|nr:SOS response-associated peptidase family protein [Sphingomonas japonica]NIJ24350.1 putative SOS response-associated peptidase YedK [Sphingomonas japonica]